MHWQAGVLLALQTPGRAGQHRAWPCLHPARRGERAGGRCAAASGLPGGMAGRRGTPACRSLGGAVVETKVARHLGQALAVKGLTCTSQGARGAWGHWRAGMSCWKVQASRCHRRWAAAQPGCIQPGSGAVVAVGRRRRSPRPHMVSMASLVPACREGAGGQRCGCVAGSWPATFASACAIAHRCAVRAPVTTCAFGTCSPGQGTLPPPASPPLCATAPGSPPPPCRAQSTRRRRGSPGGTPQSLQARPGWRGGAQRAGPVTCRWLGRWAGTTLVVPCCFGRGTRGGGEGDAVVQAAAPRPVAGPHPGGCSRGSWCRRR